MGEREKETSIWCSTYWDTHWLILVCALTRDWTHNLGVSGRCSDNWATRPGHARKVFKHSQFLPSSCISHIPPDHTWRAPQRPTCHKRKLSTKERMEPWSPGTEHAITITIRCPDGHRSGPRDGEGNAATHLLCVLHTKDEGRLVPEPPRHCRGTQVWSTEKLWTVWEKPLLSGKRRNKLTCLLNPSS